MEIKELQDLGVLPSGKIPEIVLEIREKLMKSKGKSKWEEQLIKKNSKKEVPLPEELPQEKEIKDDIAVKVDHVTKIFDTRLKKTGVRKKEKRKYYALNDISFQVNKGEVVGLLGTNGSGKSTLLRMVTKISECTKGEIVVNGKPWLVPSKINLKNDITGEQNIEYRCALMGLRPHEIQAVKEEVIEFSELGNLLYRPAKGYSSGERARLGFSITLAMSPDIYIIDEALSVGDSAFRNKCFDKMNEIRNNENKTILFVSHNITEVRKFCTRVVWIENGHLIEDGDVETVTAHYEMYTHYKDELPKNVQEEFIKEKQKDRDLSIIEWKEREANARK